MVWNVHCVYVHKKWLKSWWCKIVLTKCCAKWSTDVNFGSYDETSVDTATVVKEGAEHMVEDSLWWSEGTDSYGSIVVWTSLNSQEGNG